MSSSNVDPQQIRHFNQLAAAWWDEHGDFKTLHQLNPLRLQYITDNIQLNGKNVLDVGCGGGILSEALAHAGAKVTAIDLADEALEVAKLHLYESGAEVDYQHISAEELSEQQPERFDVITCMEMLEHVPDPLSIIAACNRLLKPGGQLFLSTLNRNLKSFLFAIIGAEYIAKILPKGTHQYDQFIRPSELARGLRQYDFELNNMCGIDYNPLSQHFTLTPNNISINYLAHAQKI